MNRHAILSGKAGLAGIHWAIQGQAARRLIRARLDKMLCDGYRAGHLRLTRAKYKPGRKINTYYQFSITDPAGTGTNTALLSVTWLDDLNSATPPDQLAQTQEEIQARGMVSPFINLWDDILAWRIRLQAWPLDPEFPQLARLSDNSYLADFLQTAGLPHGFTGHGRIHPVRFRPGERHVLRIHLNGNGSNNLLYAKLYRDGEAAGRAFRIANRVVDWLNASGAAVQGARPAGWSQEDAAILYPRIRGKALSQQLDRDAAWLHEQLRRIGAALRVLHSGPPSLAVDLEPNTIQKECKVIRRASELIYTLLPEDAEQIETILEEAQAQYEQLPQEPATFTHSDFKADHLMTHPKGLTLFDFDTCALADPAIDLGKFLADLEWAFLRSNTAGLEAAQNAFLQGYDREGAADRIARARIFHALILLKIAARRAPLYSKNWAEITGSTIHRAGQVLAKTLEPRKIGG